MGYEQAVQMLSDLAYVVIPFDKTLREYNLLLARIKVLLQNQKGNVKLCDLIDGVLKLGIEQFDDLIRQKVRDGDFSRSPKDICSTLYFFSLKYKLNKQQKDLDTFRELLKELKFMQLMDLKIEQLNLVIKAFSMSVDFLKDFKQQEDFKLIEDFIPKLITYTLYEIPRCNVSDIINIIENYYKLWNKNAFKTLQMKNVYEACEEFFTQYLALSKKDITGSQFSSLIDQIGKAKEAGIHTFQEDFIHKIQHIFINDHSELYIFTISDILKIYRSFKILDTYFNKDKLITALVKAAQDIESGRDSDYLELWKEFNKIGILDQDENLMYKIRTQFDTRFEMMERADILDYIEFFKDIGMLFQDKYIMSTMTEYFDRNYHSFDVNEIFKLYSLLSHDFYRNDIIVNLMEDTLKIRLSEESERQKITSKSLMNLISGLQMFNYYNKKLDFILRRQLKEGNYLNLDKKLLVVAIGYFSDFNIKLDETLQGKLNEAVNTHLESYEQRELAHLLLHSDVLYKDTQQKIESQIDIKFLQNDVIALEKLALKKKYQFTEQQIAQQYKYITEGSNVLEIMEEILKKEGKSYEKSKQVCDNYLQAPLVVDQKYIIDVLDEEMGQYLKDGQLIGKKRTQLAKQITQEYGFKDFQYISLLEMDFSQNEEEYLSGIIKRFYQ